MRKSKRVLVTFTNEQWHIIENLQGDMGNGEAVVVRNIVLSWLAEKSLISTSAKARMAKGKDVQ